MTDKLGEMLRDAVAPGGPPPVDAIISKGALMRQRRRRVWAASGLSLIVLLVTGSAVVWSRAGSVNLRVAGPPSTFVTPTGTGAPAAAGTPTPSFVTSSPTVQEDSPMVSASPSSGLINNEMFRVSLSGFHANLRVYLYECSPSVSVNLKGPCLHQLGSAPFVDLSPAGTGTSTVQAKIAPSFGLSNPPTSGCVVSCYLVAYGITPDGVTETASTSLAFVQATVSP
jgi:hypothetical protein